MISTFLPLSLAVERPGVGVKMLCTQNVFFQQIRLYGVCTLRAVQIRSNQIKEAQCKWIVCIEKITDETVPKLPHRMYRSWKHTSPSCSTVLPALI